MTTVLPYSGTHGSLRGGFWTQTSAMFLDAYRDLHSKKLFWITLVLSLVIVLGFAVVGLSVGEVALPTTPFV